MAYAKNTNAKHKRDVRKAKSKAGAGKEMGHGKGGVRKTSKVKPQSVKSNRSDGGKKGSKAGKAKGGAKSSRKGVPNGSKQNRNYKQEKLTQRRRGEAPKRRRV